MDENTNDAVAPAGAPMPDDAGGAPVAPMGGDDMGSAPEAPEASPADTMPPAA